MGRCPTRIAIAGDLHGLWDAVDDRILERLDPDVVLVVGDLGEGDDRMSRMVARLPYPVACILGNHDAARDTHGEVLRRQLHLLGDVHCGWGVRRLEPPGLAVVGGRPASSGGGYVLSAAVRSVWGPVPLETSIARITTAAATVSAQEPLVLLGHVGPTGLGSAAHDVCGRDWCRPARDWGDLDLAAAITRIRRWRPLPLVVFGHMHHRLRGGGQRRSFLMDCHNTAYLNAAMVPRHGRDEQGRPLRHFAMVHLEGHRLLWAAQCWFDPEAILRRQECLYRAPQG